jgi:hypothetical protein
MKSGIVHSNAKSLRNAEQFPVLTSLVPDVHPNAAPQFKRNRPEYINEIPDVFSDGGFSAEFVGARSIGSLIVISEERLRRSPPLLEVASIHRWRCPE